jgi:putative methionine-R-sulfoxide reductase with GAF domain
MLVRIRRLSRPPVLQDENRTHVASLLTTVILIVIAIGIVTILAAPFAPAADALLFIASTAVLLGMCELLLLRCGRVQLAAALLVAGQWLSYTVLMLITGDSTSILAVGQFTAAVFAGLVFNGPAALIIAGLSILVDSGMVILNEIGVLPNSLAPLGPGVEWLTLTTNLIAAVAALYLAGRSLRTALTRSRSDERAQLEANRELQAIRESLEVQVASRTQELTVTTTELEQVKECQKETLHISERRADLLRASSQIARAMTQIRDLNSLLPTVTRLIGENFGFYHVAIFLVDRPSGYAVLRAANSAGGQRMLARQHRLRVGSEGIVGYVAAVGEARVALDVGADAEAFNNPDLPGTRSELAVPLRAGFEIIGVLDVQSSDEAAFGKDDVTILASLGDQIATATQNARLYQESQEALTEAENTYRRYLRHGWGSFLYGHSRKPLLSESRSISLSDELGQS